MQFGFGYTQKLSDGGSKVVIVKEITEIEFNAHFETLEFCKHYGYLKEIFSLVEENSKAFLKFMESTSDVLTLEKLKDINIILEGNRLLINYLTSTGMFIEYGKKELGKSLGKHIGDEFLRKTNKLYDENSSYRFMVLMRNYAMHYGFPLHTHVNSLTSQSGLFAEKSILLGFKKWKHATSDIKKMPENIMIEPHVILMQKYITELFNHCLLFFSKDLIDAIKYINGLIKLVQNKEPIFISFENVDQLKLGEGTLHFVEVALLQRAHNDLRNLSNNRVEEKINEYIDVRLEFYYNNKLILEGPIKSFVNKKSNSNSIFEKNSVIELGEVFKIEDYPKPGSSTIFRVMKMTKLSDQPDAKPEIIKYYLEIYSK